MLTEVVVAFAIVAICAVIHTSGILMFAETIIRRRLNIQAEGRLPHDALLLILVFVLIILLHLSEAALWAAFYRWLCFPLWESAFYFSTSSYATVGYGDIVLPQMWRTLGPVESIIGVLMCGLSASFLFAIVSRLVDRETKLSREPAKPHSAYIEGETIPTI